MGFERRHSKGRHIIACVVGARPNFIKIAPIMAALNALGSLSVKLIHTGQHYDAAMNEQHFSALGLPRPDFNLEVGSGTHAQQTANVMLRFEEVLKELRPSAVLVVGDVNSTLAAALTAVKEGVPVFHVEAGLRARDRSIPEEINRVLTDQISELLFATERSAADNLLREGIPAQRVHFVGNVMIDTLRQNLEKAVPVAQILRIEGHSDFPAAAGQYAVLTMHRPSNVDDPRILHSLLATILRISDRLPVIFPVHPRTRAMMQQAGLDRMLDGSAVLQLPPMGYLEMLGLLKDARVVLTDSGGIQEETTALGVPCLTLRNNTERWITVDEGTSTIVGRDPQKIMQAFDNVMKDEGKMRRVPELWDGHAALRIANIIADWLQHGARGEQ